MHKFVYLIHIEMIRCFKFVLDRMQKKKSTDITKREQLLIETLREYEHRLSRTGFENDINVRIFSFEN